MDVKLYYWFRNRNLTVTQEPIRRALVV